VTRCPVIKSSNLVKFLLLPLVINLALLVMYFSGNYWAQQVIAPTVNWLPENSQREFGLIEILQLLLLLKLVLIFIGYLITSQQWQIRAVCLVVIGGFSFILLEEIDYGIHFYEIATHSDSGLEVRNWHNLGTGQGNRIFKSILDLVIFLWFFLLPLITPSMRAKPFSNFVPSRWFSVAVLIGFCVSRLAHQLEDLGFDVINGVHGNLHKNISEFRELNTYYLLALYALTFKKLSPQIGWFRRSSDKPNVDS
jgi:hypothetical protein